MCWQMFTMAVAGLVLAGQLRAEDPAKQDLEKFQGTWRVMSAVFRGKEVPASDARKLQIVFKGDKLVIKSGSKTEDASFKLDQSKKPAEITIYPVKPDPGEDVVKGIYQLQGDRIRLSYAKDGTERPKDLESKGRSIVSLIMEREK